MSEIGSANIWAETGGLAGLVILALFAVILFAMHSAKYVVHAWRDEICKLLDVHAKEREIWGKMMDNRQQETNEAIRGMTAVISDLASRSRRYDRD